MVRRGVRRLGAGGAGPVPAAAPSGRRGPKVPWEQTGVPRRALAALLVTALAVVVPASPALADPPVTAPGVVLTDIAVTAPATTLLAGGTTAIEVTATNTAGPDLYNSSVVAVLPAGVSYVPGTAGGMTGLGEPQVLTGTPIPATSRSPRRRWCGPTSPICPWAPTSG